MNRNAPTVPGGSALLIKERPSATAPQNVTPSVAPAPGTGVSAAGRQALQLANSASFAYYIATDSTAGNLILPVVPLNLVSSQNSRPT